MKRFIKQQIVQYFLNGLKQLDVGSLTIITPLGVTRRYEGRQAGVEADMTIYDWDVIVNAARRGDIGLGEDYIDGKWDSSDIGKLIELFLRNMEVFERFAHGNAFNQAIFRLVNALRSNRKAQSRRNIIAHYDVGNEFYQLWLDDSMTYSSALYEGDERQLREAQRAKYQRIIQKIAVDAQPKEILEIGCGWGGFAEAAAMQQHHVTGLTLSPSQLVFAEERLKKKGLLERAKLKLQDYRDSSGTFDAIVSIEMFEAVGEQYWPSYFKTVKERLKQDGTAVIQTITVDDVVFEEYRKRSDFIRQYTFPGGMLPSVSRFCEEASKAGLSCREVYSFGLDYAKTLRAWLERFDAHQPTIRQMGYSDNFIRSWRFYLGMCIGAFSAGRTNVVQVELTHA